MKKRYIIIFVLLAIYLILGLLLFTNKDIKNNNIEYLLIGNDIKLSLYNGKWDTIKDNVFDTKFYIYDNNKYKGVYEIKYHNDKMYLFDDYRNSIKLDGELIATSSKNIEVKEFEINGITNTNNYIIKEIEKENKLKIENMEQFSINQKIVLDFDNDGKNEELYLLSNMFNMDVNQIEKALSYVLYVDNKKIQKIINLAVNDNERFDSYSYYISGIIDYNNDKKYELIISKGMFRPYPSCQIIYELSKGKYIPIKSCD